MTKRRIATEPRRYWTDAEHAQFVAQYPHMQTKAIAAMLERPIKAIYTRAKAYGLCKSAEYLASPLSGRTNGRQGVGTRFVKGQASWNKGRSYRPGGRVAEGWFPKGAMPHNHVPVGTEVLDTDGYRKVKLAEPKVWDFLHRLVWQSAVGPIPKGSAVVFKDGNKMNCDPANLECFTRAELLARNWHNRYPKAIKQITQLRGAIARQINKRNRA